MSTNVSKDTEWILLQEYRLSLAIGDYGACHIFPAS